MLLCSLEEGSYLKDYKQFNMIHKMRTALLNAWGASARSMLLNVSSGKEDRMKDRLSQCPMDLEWFGCFNLGCKKQMGQDVHPQLGLSIEVMKEYMDWLEIRWLLAMDMREQDLVGSKIWLDLLGHVWPYPMQPCSLTAW
jgi:hypothetical protein